MKKILLLFSLLLLFGCSLNNTPTSKVEELFSKYQMLDDDIKDEISLIVNDTNLSTEEQEKYRKVIEKQYQNLTYEIKEEVIDGDYATVTTSIEVVDYKKAINEVDLEYESKTDYTDKEYNTSKLDKLDKAKDMVTYTIDITLTKDEEGNWKLNKLNETDLKKIQGMY